MNDADYKAIMEGTDPKGLDKAQVCEHLREAWFAMRLDRAKADEDAARAKVRLEVAKGAAGVLRRKCRRLEEEKSHNTGRRF